MTTKKAVVGAAVSGSNSYTPGNATLWGPLGGCNGDSRLGAESQAQVPFGQATSLEKMNVIAGANSNGMQVQLRKNGGSVGNFISLPGGISVGSDLSHVDTILQGDLVNIQTAFNGFSGFAFLDACSLQSDVFGAPMCNVNGGTVNHGSTQYWGQSGQDNAGSTVDGFGGIRIKAMTVSYFGLVTLSNTLNGTLNGVLRKNSTTDLNSAVSVAAGLNIHPVDLSHVDTLVDDDILYMKTTNAASSGTCQVITNSVWQAPAVLQTLAGSGCGAWAPNQAGNSNFANLAPYGNVEITSSGILQRATAAAVPFACTWSKLRLAAVSNGTNGTVNAVGDLNDGTPGSQALTMASGFSGNAEDLSHVDTIVPTINLLYKLTSAATSGNFSSGPQTSQLNGGPNPPGHLPMQGIP